MHENPLSRRSFLHRGAFIPASGAFIPGFRFHIGRGRSELADTIIGHGDFRYRVDAAWGNLDPAATPVENCHDVCVDDEEDLYVCQWNAGRSFPIKLHRVA